MQVQWDAATTLLGTIPGKRKRMFTQEPVHE